MKHEDVKALLFEFKDGAVSPAETAEVEAHGASCAECREDLARWKTIAQRYLSPMRAAPSRDEAFVQRVMSRLPEKPEPFWKFRMPPLGWALAGAAAVALWFGLAPIRRENAPESAESGLEYAAEVMESAFDETEIASADLGTSIEVQFLEG